MSSEGKIVVVEISLDVVIAPLCIVELWRDFEVFGQSVTCLEDTPVTHQ
jgi:hypothetical protein